MIPPPPAHSSALALHIEMLCRARAWTSEDLAAACGITVNYLNVIRSRYLRDLPWIKGTDHEERPTWQLGGPGVAYRWVTPEEGPVLQLLVVCGQYEALVRSYAAENARLAGKVDELLARATELEDLIIAERLRRVATV